MSRSLVRHLAMAASAAAIAMASPSISLAAKADPNSTKLASDPVDFTGVWFTYQPEGFGFQPAPELTPAADKALKEWRALGAKGITPPTASGRCIPPGLPSLFVRVYPMRIVRTPKDFIAIHEYENQLRFIFTDGRKHPAVDDLIPSFNGHSVAHWEGKALVIDTIGFKTEVADLPTQPMPGLSISEDFHLVERWSLSENDNLLTVDMEITDPTLFIKPWKTMKRFKRRNDLELMEYTCLPDENPITVDASGKEVFKSPGAAAAP